MKFDMPKILIVDDEPDIIELLDYNLVKEGYQTQHASNGQQAIEIAQKFKPDLILLDVMMPYLNGIETARQLRNLKGFENTYILFLTSMASEQTEIQAFNVGANDYIIKPIKPQALLSRISSYFKRGQAEKDALDAIIINLAGIELNKTNHSVQINGKAIILPKKEFELLYFFMQKPDKIFTREQLLLQIWGSEIYVVERTIDVHIRKIREKIGDNYIKTFKGVGYMFSSQP